MSAFRADLPADKACTAFTVIDQIALIGSRRAEESRTINALRADAFADIFDQLADHGSVHLHTILGKGHSNCDPRRPCPNHPEFPIGDSPGRSGPGFQGMAEGAVVSDSPGDDIGGAAVEVFDDAINGTTTDRVSDQPDLRTSTAASPQGAFAQEAALDGTADDEGRTELEIDPHPNPGKVGVRHPEVSRPSGRMVSPVVANGAAQQLPASVAVHCDCDDPRTSSAIRPVLGLGTHQSRATGLNVTIAATTLAGLDDLPGELDGHGAIPADLSRALAASAATVTAVAVDPSCGTALDLGRTVYRPRQAQRDCVNQRDQTCRFPSCRQPPWRCQLDHSDEFCPGKQDGGVTCPCNLACLCKFHHDLKTFGLWDIDHHADNSITFTSPTGRTYTTHGNG